MPFSNFGYRVDEDDPGEGNVKLQSFVRHSFRAGMGNRDESGLPPYGNGLGPASSQETIKESQRATRKSKYNWKHFLPCAPRDKSQPAIDDAGFLSLIFMSWATPVIKQGFKKSLQIADLDKLSPYESADYNFQRINRLWHEEVKQKGHKDASLARVVFRSIRTRAIVGVVFFLLCQVVTFLSPALFIFSILQYLESKNSSSVGTGIAWALGLVLCELSRSALLSMSFFTNVRTGTRARAMILAMVYDKMCKLRNVGDKSIGEFVNLCASDAQRIYEAAAFNSFVFGGPFVVLMAIIYTIYLIGPAAILGCAIFFLFFPLQGVIGRVAGRLRGKVVRITDKRVRMMNEILTCMKLIKMYAWEESFAKAVSVVRSRERGALMKSAFLIGVNMSIAMLVPSAATIATFCVHIASGRNLSAAEAFTVLTIYNVLSFSFAVLPFGVRALAEANIALKRLKSLLDMEEMEHFTAKPSSPGVALAITKANFAWDKVASESADPKQTRNTASPKRRTDGEAEEVEFAGTNDQKRAEKRKPPAGGGPAGRGPRAPVEMRTTLVPTLFDVDLTVRSGSLIGICGSVGSGKSSLLQSVLGQMRLTDGNVAISGSIAYVAQQAWIMNASARDNILFGQPYDKAKYQAVCFASSLQPDFAVLPNGDLTEVGERGLNLSGGQKQRLSLARALYSNKEIYILDDPLSAVDAHVGQHIFTHLITAALKDKTVLFATHQLHYLANCDQVLYMKEGRISERGSYDQLIADDQEFSRLIKEFLSEIQDELAEEEGESDEEQTPAGEATTTTTTPSDSRPASPEATGSMVSYSSPDGAGKVYEVHLDASSFRKDGFVRRSGSRPAHSDTATPQNPGTPHGGRKVFDLNGTTLRLDGSIRRSGSRPAHSDTGALLTPGTPDGDRKAFDLNRTALRADGSVRRSGVARRSRSGTSNSLSFEPFRQSESGRSRAGSQMGGHKPDEPALKKDAAAKREQAGKLIQEEDREAGAVKLQTYTDYIKSAGGFFVCFGLFLFVVVILGIQTFIDYWLGLWLDDATNRNLTSPESPGIIAGNPRNTMYILVYALSGLLFLVGLLVKSYLFVKVCLRASSQMHDRVFLRVLRAPMSFFDTTPNGRIVNRFSKDLDEVDSQLPFSLNLVLQNILRIFISLGIIASIFPWFLIAVVPLAAIFLALNYYFRRAVRELKRLDGTTRSPVFSHVTATVQGLSTLHAFKKMEEFNERFKNLLDTNTRPFFMFFCSNRWLAVRLDMLTITITGVTALMVVLIKGTLPAAFAGLALTYAMRITGLFQFTVRMAAETEARFTSVERINHYIRSVPNERDDIIPSNRPPDDWPQEGAIKMNDVKMRYRPGLPLVLHGVTCDIQGQEKIGIVGRTGSGKSSLAVVLLQLVEVCEGSICIDGVDVSKLGLEDLRSRISIIPQDPVLFVGTIRYNLDPFDQFSDTEIWTALERAHLSDMVSKLPRQLMAPVVENGENFSVGERQLMCMARALLRHCKILMLDEATAAIDTETDAKIQNTIQESFRDCTTLTIAHRLNTVLNSDRIMVMSDGKIAEFDKPSRLMSDPDSAFSQLMQAAELQKDDKDYWAE